MEKKKTRNVVLCVIAVLLCGVFYVCANDKLGKSALTEKFTSGNAFSTERTKEEGDSSTGESSQTEKDSVRDTKVYIDISGAVKKAGVYVFDYEPRLVEVIERAGGLTKKADTSSVNQAQIVSDGTQIVIASKSSGKKKSRGTNGDDGSEDSTKAVDTDGTVNINSATREELMTLNGVGESRANDILSYREANGNFKKIEDIMNVPGIKEGIFNQIKDKIKV